jgi:hypothetical protein
MAKRRQRKDKVIKINEMKPQQLQDFINKKKGGENSKVYAAAVEQQIVNKIK